MTSEEPTGSPKGFVARTAFFIRSIGRDLQCFGWKAWTLLTIFGVLMVVFSVIDFNYVFGIEDVDHLLVWDNDKDFGFSYTDRILMTVSGGAAWTGAMTVVLTSKGKVSSYFWGLINTILYGMFAWAYGYSGDAQLNLFYFLPLQFVGIHLWLNNLDRTETAISRSLGIFGWLLVLIFTAAVGYGFYHEIPWFAKETEDFYVFEDDETPHRLDATSNALSVTAMLLLLGRFWEQWLFWIAVDIVQIIMFAGVAGFGVSFNIISMWSLFLCNAFYGLYCWYTRKRMAGSVVGTTSDTV